MGRYKQKRVVILYYPGKKAKEEVKIKVIQEELPLMLPEQASRSQNGVDGGQKRSEDTRKESERFPVGQDKSCEDSGLTPEEQELLLLLRARRIGARSALEIVKTSPERIREKVEIFDWIVQQGREKIQSPTGFLRRMIEEDWLAPEGFVSEAERQQQEEERRQREEKRRCQEEARRAAEATTDQARQQRREASPYKMVWEQITKDLTQRMPRQSFAIWIQPLFLAHLHDDALIIDCPSRFIKEYVEEKYHALIEEAVAIVCGEEKRVILACSEEKSPGV
jgi:hypothetical protein